MKDFNTYQKLLTKFVAFKSVSTDPKYKDEIKKTVLWLLNIFKENGFDTKVYKGKSCNPVVFSSLVIDKKLPTVMIYGHYDVQPADTKDGWKSDPFTLKMDNKKLYARGVVDNKGQVLVHIATAIKLKKNNRLKYNVKFLIEGNEETSNEDLAGIMQKNKKSLECDFVMVSDGELTNNKPTIEVSLRGGFSSTLTYKTGKNNLHSGLAGGAVPNAAVELSKLISKIYDDNGVVIIKDFLSGVDEPEATQLENNKLLAKEAGDVAKLLGVQKLLLPKGSNFFTQTGLSSTIQVTGFKSGYIDTGYSNIVPAQAEVKLNFRLTASQKPEKIIKVFERFVKTNTPEYVNYTLSFASIHSPIKVNTDNLYVKRAKSVLKSVYKTEAKRRNVGGAIPFVGDVKNILGVDTLLIPLANEDCNMHGVQENLDIDLAKKSLEFSEKFLSSQNE